MTKRVPSSPAGLLGRAGETEEQPPAPRVPRPCPEPEHRPAQGQDANPEGPRGARYTSLEGAQRNPLEQGDTHRDQREWRQRATVPPSKAQRVTWVAAGFHVATQGVPAGGRHRVFPSGKPQSLFTGSDLPGASGIGPHPGLRCCSGQPIPNTYLLSTCYEHMRPRG